MGVGLQAHGQSFSNSKLRYKEHHWKIREKMERKLAEAIHAGLVGLLEKAYHAGGSFAKCGRSYHLSLHLGYSLPLGWLSWNCFPEML